MTTLFEEQMGARVQTPLFEFCAKPGLSSRRPAGDWQLATTTTATGTVTTLGGTTLATSAGGLTAAGAALNAGFAGLASTASVSLINNGGDIGKTLRELGRKDSLKSLLLSMATAGALNGLSNSLTINGQTLASITPQTADFGANLAKAAINNVASATINSALTGASLEDSIQTASVGALASTAGAFGAQAIGSMTVPNAQGQSVLNPAGQLLAHALVGCLAGAAGGGSQGCHSGAIGATVGELAAQWFDPNGTKTEAEVLEFAKLMGATAGALTGDGSAASVNTAANTAANAVQNNYLETRDLKNAIAQLENCKVGCDSQRRLLLGNESAGGQQKPVGRLVDQCKANPQACSTRVQDMAQALQDLQSPEVRAVLGGATADRLIQRQVNDLGQALNALKWGAEHMQSSTAIMRGALMVGATAAGAGVLVPLGRALVAACSSGIGTPACNALVTELGIGVSEAASGAPTLGVSAPVVGVAAARLANAAKSADPATVAREVQAVLGEAKASEAARVLNNFYRDGAPPELIQKTYNLAATTSTHNASASEVV